MTSPDITHVTTADGMTIARCHRSGLSASGRNLAEALAELRRLLAHGQASVDAPSTPLRQGAAA